MLVDTGVARSAARIGAAIRDLGRAPGDVRAIVLTHLHRDHTGALAEVKSRTGAEVWMHPADAALVREGVFVRPLEPGRALCGAPSRASATAGRRRAASPGRCRRASTRCSTLLADGYESVAGASFTVTM